MSEMPDPVKALMAFLAADTDIAALVSGRVFGGELPETEIADMPRSCIVITHAGGGSIGAGWVNYTDLRFDVFAYGATRLEAARLWRAVHRALKLFHREVWETVLLHWARQAGGPTPLRDPDTTFPYVLSTWQVLLSEVAA